MSWRITTWLSAIANRAVSSLASLAASIPSEPDVKMGVMASLSHDRTCLWVVMSRCLSAGKEKTGGGRAGDGFTGEGRSFREIF